MIKRYCVLVLCLLTYTSNINGQIITTIAGGVTGHGGFWGDGGPATAAEFSAIGCFAIDISRNIYLADPGNKRIRKVDAMTGIVNTVAGTGATGYSPDGTPATAAMFKYPCNVTIDAIGNLYIQDCDDYRIRKIDIITGLISTFAGNGVHGYFGDGGPATAAQLYNDGFSCWDRFGNMYLGVLSFVQTKNGNDVFYVSLARVKGRLCMILYFVF